MLTPEQARERMVEEQLVARMIRDPRVLGAFRTIPRHLFVPEELCDRAYEDGALPIGSGQTISQPFMVALMVEALRLQGHERVLEIGTGSGYQAAILSQLALEVYSIERLPELAAGAQRCVESLQITNVTIAVRDGTLGWPEHAPYEGIIVAAGAPEVPDPLAEQLAAHGRLVIPIGGRETQTLYVMQRQEHGLVGQRVTECLFVPLKGQHGWPL